MAAKWEMEDRLSSESARQLFLRALRFHPHCPKLYQEVSVWTLHERVMSHFGLHERVMSHFGPLEHTFFKFFKKRL